MKATILFVDDEINAQHAIRRIFRGAEFNVITAGSPAEILERLDTIQPDVVISDYSMPGMDGISFLKIMEEIWPDSQRILMTGHADLELAQKAIAEAKICRLLTKPWNNLELREAVEAAIWDQDRRREATLSKSNTFEIGIAI